MTVIRHLQARTVYRCDICGDEGILPRDNELGTSWRRYTSIAHDETCPDDVPTLCGDACMKEFKTRLADGRIRLPVLKETPGYWVVSKPKFGYPVERESACTSTEAKKR